jgi:hypothetical protein
MKRITGSEARRQWFRLLDEVVAGEEVVLERNGHRVIVRREDSVEDRERQKPPNYNKLLRAPDADQAHQWTWDWQGPQQELALIGRRKR